MVFEIQILNGILESLHTRNVILKPKQNNVSCLVTAQDVENIEVTMEKVHGASKREPTGQSVRNADRLLICIGEVSVSRLIFQRLNAGTLL